VLLDENEKPRSTTERNYGVLYGMTSASTELLRHVADRRLPCSFRSFWY
jgi:hypothetical protein